MLKCAGEDVIKCTLTVTLPLLIRHDNAEAEWDDEKKEGL